MPPKIKSPQEIQAMRTSIIDAARDLLINKGVDGVTMRDIAKSIGYSATTIYLHFADKETLIRDICDDDLLTLAEALKHVISNPDPKQRLLNFGQAYAHFALTHPNHYRLLFMSSKPPIAPEDSNVAKNSIEQDAYFQLKTVVKDAYDANVFVDSLNDPTLIAQTIWAAIHGVCSLEIALQKDCWVDWCPTEQRLNAMMMMITKAYFRE